MNIKEIIFKMYKDEAIVCKDFKRGLAEKYKLDMKEIGDIYARIINYQVKKYGVSLDHSRGCITTSEEQLKRNHNSQVRRYKRKHRGE